MRSVGTYQRLVFNPFTIILTLAKSHIMKKVILFVLLIRMSGFNLPAQDRMLTLDDCVINYDLYPENLSQLKWQGNTSYYTYVDQDLNMVLQGSPSGDEKPIFGLSYLNAVIPEGVDSMKRIPAFNWFSDDEIGFQFGGYLWSYHLGDKNLIRRATIPEDAESVEIADNYNVAFTKDNNVFVSLSAISKTIQISTDGSHDLVYGEAAHRFEFGIQKGMFWSPSGDKLAFYRVDQSMVTDYPIIDYSEIPAKMNPDKYPFAGDNSHHATVGVFDIRSGETTYLQTGGPPEQYLTNITWSPDGKRIFLAIVNRGQDTMQLNVYHAMTGAYIKTLFTETDKEYVEPEHGPAFHPDGSSFIWQSERDGYNHLYLYTTEGKLLGQLTAGNWEVTDFIGFDKTGKKAFYASTQVSPLERHLYALDIRNRKTKQLTDVHGTHSGQLSKDGRYMLDNYSSTDVPRQIDVLNCRNGKTEKTLLTAPDPLQEYNLGEMSLFSINADDGTELFCRMIKPIGFDPDQQYPVFVYLYGGPHLQLVRDRWNGGAQLFLQYMAQQGFVVFTLDNRGSSGRGLGFEQAIFERMGTLEIEDQMVGVKYLHSQPFVDRSKMAVYGWSYGGFMATSMMLRKPGAFQVGVAGGPVTDWRLYEVMYGERYMNTPQENPEGYAESRLMNHIGNLEGKLLIIHGLLDNTVVPQHTRALLQAAVKEGILIDYYAYPDHPHNVRGKDRAHLLHKVSDYVIEKLK